MKTLNMSSLQKLISFILIVVLLICTVGFAADGWQSPSDEPDSGKVDDTTGEADENKDGNTPPPSESTDPPDSVEPDINEPEPTPPTEEPPVEEPKPVYKNSITGLEITAEQSTETPLGFVLDPESPLYGVSSADLTLEFPIEDGSTRMLSYTTNYSMLWKVGTLAPTRAFISGSSNFFGGVVISYGNDDIVRYSAWDTDKIDLDISKITDCYYVENTLYVYTSKDLVDIASKSSPQLSKTPYKTPPFIFNDAETDIIGTTEAKTVTIPYSSKNETELYYSETSGKYLYFKSGARKVDMLNGKNVAFTNVFVLFANATTYEKADGTELVIDTLSGGTGYYISKGYLTEIRWSIDEGGSLKFKTLSGEQLTVNAGSSYISYYKASNASKVKAV